MAWVWDGGFLRRVRGLRRPELLSYPPVGSSLTVVGRWVPPSAVCGPRGAGARGRWQNPGPSESPRPGDVRAEIISFSDLALAGGGSSRWFFKGHPLPQPPFHTREREARAKEVLVNSLPEKLEMFVILMINAFVRGLVQFSVIDFTTALAPVSNCITQRNTKARYPVNIEL